jgi:sugar phosphate isomerase/epimerase
MLRRTFLETTGAAAFPAQASSASAASTAHIPLGFDTYSLRAFRWKALELIEYAAGLKLDTIQISSLDDFESLDEAHLARVKERASRLGISLDAGIGCVCSSSAGWKPDYGSAADYLVKGMTVAKAIGADSMRCFLGSGPDRTGPVPIERHIENTIQAFRSVRTRALDLGVTIALENHNGDVTAREVRTIVEESGKDFTGSNLDTGNPMTVMEDPFSALEILAPYAFPKMPAADFARFLALERKGQPYSGFMIAADGLPQPPAPYTAALKEQQRYDLERSLEYAKRKLGVGVRWRTAA